MKKTVGIVGLGLMGGSLAKSFKNYTNYQVLGYDICDSTNKKAVLLEAVDQIADPAQIAGCDLVFIALYPEDTVAFMQKHVNNFKPGAIICDLGGVKEYVCDMAAGLGLAPDVTFIGGHPMAGREFSGFDHSQTELFAGASMILTPTDGTPIEKTNLLRGLFLSLGFANVVITNPQNHDRIIALTSQLAHVVSNSFVKSPAAQEHRGFSAGSFKDLTRVAKLNPDMWSQLFMLNRDNLLDQLDRIIADLQDYYEVLAEGDRERLKQMLKEGSDIKEKL